MKAIKSLNNKEHPDIITFPDEQHANWREVLEIWLLEQEFNLKRIWIPLDISVTPEILSLDSQDDHNVSYLKSSNKMTYIQTVLK